MDSTALTPVPVPGTDRPLMAAEIDGRPMVAVASICEALGVDPKSQRRKLQSKGWATGVMMTLVAADEKRREMYVVDRRTLTMWLATIDANRVSDTARPTLEAFQSEAADALDAYFHDGGAINPSATPAQLDTLVAKATGQMELIRAAEGIIDARFLEAKARIVLARGLGEAPQIEDADRPLYVQDYLQAKGLTADMARQKSSGFGKRVKGRFMELHGEAPAKHFQEVDGRPREVNAYTESDRPVFDHVWTTYYEQAVA